MVKTSLKTQLHESYQLFWSNLSLILIGKCPQYVMQPLTYIVPSNESCIC